MDRYTTQVELLGKTEYEQELIKGTAEIEKKYGDQIAALEAKKATAKGQTLKLIQESIDELEGLKTSEQDIFEITAKQTFEYRQQEESLKRIGEQFTKQIQSQETLNNIIRNINQQQSSQDFEKSLKGLSPLRAQIAKINEEAKKMATEAGNAFAATFEDKGFLTPEEAQELSDGLSQIAQGYKNIANEQIKSLGVSQEYLNGFSNFADENLRQILAFQEEFKIGVKDAFASYAEDALDAGKQAKDGFATFTQGMEDAFAKFAMGGKLSFKDLANSILADLARIAVKRAIVFAATRLFGIPGLAEGGPAMPNRPYIVGEQGPELFVPKSAGTVVPNSAISNGGANVGMGPTTVNYNIQAVDAASFRSMVARDPSFIYAVTEQGRRSQPTRSR
jgi:phage-related minor tail protein